jgi:serine/threonine protein kinase/Flp pilus assembly protein TadD
MRRRWQLGERPRAECYIDLNPELLHQAECALEVIYEEIQIRQEEGEKNVWSDVCRRFPQWHVPLRALRECHELIDSPRGCPEFPEVGDVVGGFRLAAELGRGAYGRVFVATQPSLADRPLVVKLTPQTGREHLSLARLQHTSIVPLYSAHDDPGRRLRVLCMPYFGGATLAELCAGLAPVPLARRGGHDLVECLNRLAARFPVAVPKIATPRQLLPRLDFAQAVCWVAAVCAEALQYAHERRLLHLDVKPSNILIAADGQPMLLDFHLAREPLQPDEVAPESLGGTFAYMAPEHRRAVEAVGFGGPVPTAVDCRADVYGLGAVVYESLGGTVPIRTPIRPLFEINPQVSVGLSDIVAKSLASDPEERYIDAAAFAADLRRHLGDLPLESVTNRSLLERWRKWRRRRPPALRLAGVIVLASLAIAGPAVGYAAHVAENRERAERALIEGAAQFRERGHHEEAIATLRGGLVLAADLPFCAEVRDRLREQLEQVELAQAAARQERLVRDLHALVDQLRSLYGAKLSLNEQFRVLLDSCRAMWDNRHSIRARLASGQYPELDIDLLDLAILWTGLRGDADRQDALRVLDEAESLYGASPVLTYERERLRHAMGVKEEPGFDPPRARTAWEEYALGRSLLQSGELAQAAKYLSRAVALQPAGCWVNYYFGVAALRLNRFEEAAAAFSVCIGSSPDLAAGYYNRALAFTGLGRNELAIRDYTRALHLTPGLVDAILNRGSLYFRLNQQAAAIADFERTLELGGRRADTHYNLALVYLSVNDTAAALTHLCHAIDHEPKHHDSLELLRKIRSSR